MYCVAAQRLVGYARTLTHPTFGLSKLDLACSEKSTPNWKGCKVPTFTDSREQDADLIPLAGIAGRGEACYLFTSQVINIFGCDLFF